MDNIVDILAIIGGVYAFYNILYLRYFWKPKLHLNNGRLVCVNDGTKEIIINNIIIVFGKVKNTAVKIRTTNGKEIQSTNIIYSTQSREIEFDIEIEKPIEGKIIVEFQVDKKIIKRVISFNKNTPIYFINNRKMKVVQR